MDSQYFAIMDEYKTILFWYKTFKDNHYREGDRIIHVTQKDLTLEMAVFGSKETKSIKIDTNFLPSIVFFRNYFTTQWKKNIKHQPLYQNMVEEMWNKFRQDTVIQSKDMRYLVIPHLKEKLFYRKASVAEVKTLEAFQVMENTWGGE